MLLLYKELPAKYCIVKAQYILNKSLRNLFRPDKFDQETEFMNR